MVAVHRGFGSPILLRRERPSHAVHACRRTDARKRQRPEGRDEHDQKQKSGSPAVHGYQASRT
jgi:hypothetical protein